MNCAIKRWVTFREKLPVEEFIEEVLIKMLRTISKEYGDGKRTIANMPPVDNNLFRDASLWLPKANILRSESEQYYVASSTFTAASSFDLELVEELENKEYTSIDQYRNEYYGQFWTVEVSSTNWQSKSLCDCPIFLKNYACKHVVGIALLERYCEPPKNALAISLKQKKSKGRKPKAKSALEK